MREHPAVTPHSYRTTLDRAGLALAAGGGLGGLVALLLGIASGGRDVVQLLTIALLGSLGTLAYAGLVTPFWLALHRAGCRRAWHAALLGGTLTLLLAVALQTGWLGLVDLPGGDRVQLFRWLSALATGTLLALVAAGIALAMWRIAYRPD